MSMVPSEDCLVIPNPAQKAFIRSLSKSLSKILPIYYTFWELWNGNGAWGVTPPFSSQLLYILEMDGVIWAFSHSWL